MRTLLLAVAIALLMALPASAFEVALTVEEPAGVDRSAAPVSAGIPLADETPAQFALFDGEREIPVQVAPMVVGADGRPQWVLVDFQADLKANQTKTYTLRGVAPKVQPAKPLAVTDAADAVTIDTGAATVVISKTQPFALFSSAVVAGKPVLSGGAISYTDAFDGKTYQADKPTGVTVEYRGALRTTVCVKGGFVGDASSKLRYIARITAWAGRSDLHVKYSLSNSNPDHYAYRLISDSTIALKLAAAPAGATLGAARPVDVPAGNALLNQTSRVRPSVVHGNDALGTAPFLRRTRPAGGAKVIAEGKALWTSGEKESAEGWLLARSAGGNVAVDDLFFSDDPPRQIGVDGQTIRLSGVAAPIEGAELPFAGAARWLFDCSHLSSQYVIDLAAPADAASLSRQAKANRQRLIATAPPAWYFESDKLPCGRFGSQADEMKCYDQWDWKYEPKEAPERPGDQLANVPRWVAADDNHFTSEQDTLDALVLMYLRTGKRSFFNAADVWANYFLDLQTWRSDDWVWKDGGVWKLKAGGKGPLGNRATRAADPVTGQREHISGVWQGKAPFPPTASKDLFYVANAKSCTCHNWGEGLVEWFLITGDRDAYEAAIDTVEQQIDYHRRACGRAPGKASVYSRDFTRASYLTHATRLIAPADPLVVEASDFFAAVYLKRPNPEVRGLLNGPQPIDLNTIKSKTAGKGVDEMNRLGITLDEKTGELVDAKTNARWQCVVDPHTWMFPPLSRAMELYYSLTGNEDAHDWLIAYGQAAANVLYQPKHGNLSYGNMLADFPTKGVVKDLASWQLPDNSVNGEGVTISGYLGGFYPDVPARAYALTGEQMLKQRAFDYWFYSSHRGYNSKQLSRVGRVGTWVNVYTTHGESVCYTGRTFYEFAHPRTDEQAPEAVRDLAVRVEGDSAAVSFTVPADKGGGKVVRYQVKCSDRPILDYASFLRAFNNNEEAGVCNWWMATNLAGEPTAAPAGQTVQFKVTGVPADAKYFAVRVYDDSSNRSAMSNVFMVK